MIIYFSCYISYMGLIKLVPNRQYVINHTNTGHICKQIKFTVISNLASGYVCSYINGTFRIYLQIHIRKQTKFTEVVYHTQRPRFPSLKYMQFVQICLVFINPVTYCVLATYCVYQDTLTKAKLS